MYKNVKHYRHTVHLYLDSIWPISVNKRKARTAMYRWLSIQMGISYEECHVRWFTRNQCKQAIKILREKQIQLYGKDLVYERSKEKMEQKEVEELREQFSGSYWNYRWFKIVHDFPEYDEDGNLTDKTNYEVYYELHEVYYNKNEKVFTWTEDPINFISENALDLMDTIKGALDAAMKPVLLLIKNGDNSKVEELNEYIDGKEELTKWLKNQ